MPKSPCTLSTGGHLLPRRETLSQPFPSRRYRACHHRPHYDIKRRGPPLQMQGTARGGEPDAWCNFL